MRKRELITTRGTYGDKSTRLQTAAERHPTKATTTPEQLRRERKKQKANRKHGRRTR